MRRKTARTELVEFSQIRRLHLTPNSVTMGGFEEIRNSKGRGLNVSAMRDDVGRAGTGTSVGGARLVACRTPRRHGGAQRTVPGDAVPAVRGDERAPVAVTGASGRSAAAGNGSGCAGSPRRLPAAAV